MQSFRSELEDLNNPVVEKDILELGQKIAQFKEEWFKFFKANHADLKEKLDRGCAFDDEIKQALTQALEAFKSAFVV